MNKKELKFKADIIDAIKSDIKTLSEGGLLLDANNWIDKQEYDNDDLVHILNLFMHIVWNIQAAKLIKEWGDAEEATAMWNDLKDMIEKYLGIDTHILIDTYLNKE